MHQQSIMKFGATLVAMPLLIGPKGHVHLAMALVLLDAFYNLTLTALQS